MTGNRRQSVMTGLIGNEAAIGVNHAAQVPGNATVIEANRANIATAFGKAKDQGVGLFATGAALGLTGVSQGGFVTFDGLSSAAQWARIGRRSHGLTNTVSKVPSGFEAAAKRPLQLARRKAFLAGTKQVDCLQPKVKRQVAILENGADPDRELVPAAIAFPKAMLNNAFRVLLAWLGKNAFEAAKTINFAAMRANRAIGPKLLFDVLESGCFVVKPDIGKYRFGHD
jgi:hypothetical protein